MKIKNIKVSNFRSFDEIDIDLKDFNVLLGANASGKSNFIDIFKFLRYVEQSGLNDAISQLGGFEYFTNLKISYNKPFNLSVTFKDIEGIGWKNDEENTVSFFHPIEIFYELELTFLKNGKFNVNKDRFTFDCEYFDVDFEKIKHKKVFSDDDIELDKGKKLKAKFSINNEKGKIKFDSYNNKIKKDKIIPSFFEEIPKNKILLETPFFNMFSRKIIANDLSIFKFNPELPKELAPITGKSELEENGKNLAIVLNKILKDSKKRKEFLNLTKYLLDFIDDFNIQPLLSNQLMLEAKETFSDKSIPASFLSDGTINIILTIIALFFEDKNIVIIEEPERYIHPHLISKLIDLMQDASKNKQIIISTHCPEIVRWANKEDLLFISRNDTGFSTMSRPSQKEEIKTFLENDIKMDELFVDNLLGI